MTLPLPALLRESAAAYALGAVDEETRAAIARALPNDPELAREVESYAPVVAALGLAAPSVTPPASLRARVLANAAAVRPMTSARSLATNAERSSRIRYVPWLALAASLAVIMVQRQQVAGARREAGALAAAVSDASARLAASDSLLATVMAPEVEVVHLSSSGAPPAGRLYWNARDNRVILAAWRLAPTQPGRTYQLWGIPKGGTPVSLGTFASTGDGVVRASFQVPAGLQIAVGAVTEEPAGGSPQPTSTPFLVGQVAALQ